MDFAGPSHSINNIPKCCCGSDDCAFLVHNARQVDGLERNVSKAAELGKALLIRHESYVADSERDRRNMLTTIESLESEKRELEEKNAQSIQANRDLLDQLEQLNEAVASSDAQVQALTDTLHSTEAELQRLSTLTNRTRLLERQLSDLEWEQTQMQNILDLKTADERTAMQRWRQAEQTLAELQDQIDRIEKEAYEERERHAEVVARMERRIAVDAELATASGRLKAKAGFEKGSTSVVSHFVKDILLDNTNLQHGILELRGMLLNSNEEVERLRDQLRAHQPVTPPGVEATTQTLYKELGIKHSPAAEERAPTLHQELGIESKLSQELHIHHHYHGQAPTKNAPRSKPARRPRNKRFSIANPHYSPVQPDPSSQAAIISHTAVTVPNSNRLSNATTIAPSLPSSPVSVTRRESIYDRVFSDVAYDSSRPTSPSDSVDFQSPMFAPTDTFAKGNVWSHYRKKSQSLKAPSLKTIKSASTPLSISAKSSPAIAIVSASSPAGSLANDTFTLSRSIPEEAEDDSTSLDQHSLTSPDEASHDEDDIGNLISHMPLHRPRFRRASHDSLISVSGMDIHTIRPRPSQLFRFASPGGAGSIGPALTPWTATATADMSRRDLDSSTFNRSILHASLTSTKRNRGNTTSASLTRQNSGLTNKLGGWVFGKWGATPTPSQPFEPSKLASTTTTSSPSLSASRSSRPASTKSGETQSSADTTRKGKGKAKEEKRMRPAGVNQSGPIWGFFVVPETPTKIVVDDLDTEALGEALAEE
ncbi:hypothetical protein P280DRAFT_471329 [Massarina eburnea CBS 473.64]|uniref:Uncharacterized protein n=1 Tax=Massarina eburnea CBS 473.64 TaxID=1395130 RepID=A0A6A6RV05_9PLEO|nr:hypothetical protein P280DRAFT_471329 [Massarina eburnea CBS 473.64]